MTFWELFWSHFLHEDQVLFRYLQVHQLFHVAQYKKIAQLRPRLYLGLQFLGLAQRDLLLLLMI
jgi:hypothetical protein